jgi:hypothetical protein
MIEQEPTAFCKLIGNLMPKELNSTLDVSVDLFARARTRLEAYRLARDFIGSEDDQPLLIEAEAVGGDNEQ